MIQLENVSKHFTTGNVKTQAIDDVSLTIDSGEFVAIKGPSGAGKSTLLNVIGLLETFDSGSLRIGDQDAGRASDKKRARIRNQNFGFVFQSFNLLPYLTVYENIELPYKIRGADKKSRRDAVADLIRRFGLENRSGHRPAQLSGGQQQRVSIARALVCKPSLLLADEPTGNLNSQMAEEVFSMFSEINRSGTTIVVVTHDEALAGRVDRTIDIVDGKVS